MTEDKKYNVEDFWPGAEELLDQHYQRKSAWYRNRRLILIGLAVVAIGGFTALWLNVSSSGKVETIKSSQISDASNYKTNSIKNNNSNNTELSKSANEIKSDIKPASESKATNDIVNVVSAINENSENIDLKSKSLQTKEGNRILKSKQKNNTTKSESEIRKAKDFNNSNGNNKTKINQSKKETGKIQNTSLENIVAKESSTFTKEIELTSNNSLKPEKSVLENLKTIRAKIQPETSIFSVLNNNAANDLFSLSSIVDPVKSKNQSNAFFVKLGSGINYVDKNISSTSYPEYVSRRNDEESAAMYSTFNLHFGLIKKRFSLSTGVELNQYGENIKYNNWLIGDIETINSNVVYTTDSISNTVNYYIQGNEFNQTNFSFTTDSSLVNDTTLVKGQVSNNLSEFSSRTMFSYVEIPVILEYSVYSNRSLAISLNSGLSIGFLRATRGYYLNPALNEIMDISKNNTIRKTIFNGRIGTSFSWKIGEKSSVFLNPEYRFNLQSVFNKQSDINQRYQTIGLQFGIMKRF